MRYIPNFEDFINEAFKKPYGEKISLNDFKKIAVGSEILYAGATYEVVKNDGFVLQLKPVKGSNGKTGKINFAQFNQAGAIRENLNESVDLESLKKKYPNAKITLTPHDRFEDAYFAKVDIITQGGDLEYLGGLRGPVSKEDALQFFDQILSKNYDKYY